MDGQVIVSGGGIGGLTLALTLAQRGVHVIVIEKEKQASIKYKGELLQPKSLELLAELGVIDDVLRIGHPIYTTTAYDLSFPEKKAIWDYRVLPTNYPFALMVPHYELTALLLAKAQQWSTFHFVKPAKFISFLDGTTTAQIEHDGQVKTVRGQFFVGAEGRMSIIRKEVGIRLKKFDYNHQFLTVSFPRPAELTNGIIVSEGRRFLGLFPLANDYVRSVFLIAPNEYKAWRQKGLKALHDEYCQLYPPLRGYVEAIHSWKQIQLMIPIRHNAERYVHDNVALLGDAAHSVHPMAGEGMNMAIQDAVLLGDLLSWMFETSHLSPEYLQQYEAIRKPRAEFLSDLSHMSALAYSYHFPLWQRMRMNILQRISDVDYLLQKQMLNISGLGMWPETLFDRFVQAGIYPHNLMKRYPLQSKLFTKHDDYPWRTIKEE